MHRDNRYSNEAYSGAIQHGGGLNRGFSIATKRSDRGFRFQNNSRTIRRDVGWLLLLQYSNTEQLWQRFGFVLSVLYE